MKTSRSLSPWLIESLPACAASIVFGLASPYVSAATLGKGALKGYLGQRVEIEIDLGPATGEKIPEHCFKLAPPITGGEGEYQILQGDISVLTSGDRQLLRVRTRQVINEPIAVLTVVLGCGNQFARQYTFLPDPSPAIQELPPADTAAAAPAGSSAALATPAPTLANPPAAAQAAATETKSPAPAAVAKPVPVKRPAAKTRPKPAATAPRLVLAPPSPNDFPPLTDKSSPETRFNNRLDTLTQQDLDRERRIKELETLITEAKTVLAQLQAAAPNNPSSPPATAPGAAATAPVAAPISPALDGVAKTPEAPNAVVAPVQETLAKDNVPIPERPAAPPRAAEEPDNTVWIGLVLSLVALLAALGVAWDRRRKEKARLKRLEKSTARAQATYTATHPMDIFRSDKPENGAGSRQDGTAFPSAVESGTNDSNAIVVNPLFEGDIKNELTARLEVAEVMASFGRYTSAATEIEELIASHPDVSLRAYTALLEIYRHGDMRVKFENLNAEIKRKFNLAPQDWNQSQQNDPQQLHLDSFPHIVERITSTWGTEDCLGYLRTLLTDTRDGARGGFDAATAEELALLEAMLALRLSRSAESATAAPASSSMSIAD